MAHFLSILPKLVLKRKKRIGRGLGSGRGAKSGRGTTRHQKARGSIPLHFEGGQGRVVKKYPLLRGKGKNKSKQLKPIILKISKLNKFDDNAIINMDLLLEKKMVDLRFRRAGVKIVNDDKKLIRKLFIKKLEITSSAKKKIEELGGQVEL